MSEIILQKDLKPMYRSERWSLGNVYADEKTTLLFESPDVRYSYQSPNQFVSYEELEEALAALKTRVAAELDIAIAKHLSWYASNKFPRGEPLVLKDEAMNVTVADDQR